MYVSMKCMLDRAVSEGYAVMAINAFNLESAAGIIRAATKMRAPIIIDLLQEHLKTCFNCDILTNSLITMAQQAPIPVAINLDHGSDIAHLKWCLQQGFSSVMVDASTKSFEENLAITRSVVEFAQQFNASVEAEFGNMGLVGTGSGFTEQSMYTDPDKAIEFIQKTGVDALAISYGSTHGDYPEGYTPTFHFEILEKIRRATDVALVLHGGSGSGHENIRRSVASGITKINVGTDYMIAQRQAIVSGLDEDEDYDFPALMRYSYEEGSRCIEEYIQLSGSEGKAF